VDGIRTFLQSYQTHQIDWNEDLLLSIFTRSGYFDPSKGLDSTQFLRLVALCEVSTPHESRQNSGMLRLALIFLRYDSVLKGFLNGADFNSLTTDLFRCTASKSPSLSEVKEKIGLLREGLETGKFTFEAFVTSVNKRILRGTSQLLRVSIDDSTRRPELSDGHHSMTPSSRWAGPSLSHSQSMPWSMQSGGDVHITSGGMPPYSLISSASSLHINDSQLRQICAPSSSARHHRRENQIYNSISKGVNRVNHL